MRKAIYTEPHRVDDLTNCYFYHTIDLPGIGKVDGEWDLRPNIRRYLAGVHFREKRVLDVGCASGALSFYMEQQGANVVSFDLDESEDWDIVPFAKWEDLQSTSVAWRGHIRKIDNAYWLAHRLLNSKAQVGRFEESGQLTGGLCPLHLRDPFLALQSGLRLVKDTVIISEPLHGQEHKTTEPFLRLLPNAKEVEPKMTWWDIRPEWVIRALGILGFEDVQILYHTQRNKSQDKAELYTALGRRTHGIVGGDTASDYPSAVL